LGVGRKCWRPCFAKNIVAKEAKPGCNLAESSNQGIGCLPVMMTIIITIIIITI
jgi:hypothetical protein